MTAKVINKTDLTLDKRIVSNKWFWTLLLVFLFTYPIVRTLNRELPPELPILYKVPQFNLTDQYGKNFSNKDLEGKVYISNFIFTTCPSTCPNLSNKMKEIQKRVRGVGKNIALLSFTVDPETDTSTVLKKYADSYKANPHIWKFLTGSRSELESLLINGFKVPIGEKMEMDYKLGEMDNDVSLFDIAHSEKMVLVDQLGRVRGYYSIDTDSVNQMMIDVGLLINRKPKKEIGANI